jgi:membrane protease YdiL (CAAX protease family)
MGLAMATGVITPEPAADPWKMFGTGAIAALTALQFAAMLGPALILAAFVPFEDRPWPARMAASFPLRLGPPGYLVAALILGATAGALPSWLVEQLSDYTGWEMGIQGMIEGMNDAALPARVAMCLVVAGVAPVCEELIFRGFLWKAVERSAPPVVAWIATSVLFAAYHLDPMQVLAVLPLGVVLGWLRWRSGSLWAPMIFHVVNNGLALVLSLSDSAFLTGLGASVAAGVIAALTVGAAWWMEARPSSAPPG